VSNGLVVFAAACREELGQSSGTKRATSCVLICETPRKRKAPADGSAEKPEEGKDWKEGWDDLIKEVGELVSPPTPLARAFPFYVGLSQ
jgi:hypothetical protein